MGHQENTAGGRGLVELREITKMDSPCHCTPPPCHCTPPPMSCPLPLCHAPSPLQVLERMPDKPGLDLDQQPSWSELAVLVRMLLYLSFQDRLDGEPAHL